MKITTPETIEATTKEFIDTINAELDWGAIEKLLVEKHNFQLRDEVDYKSGDITVHGNQIAYRLDFEIKIALSLTLGKDGRCLEITTSGDSEDEEVNDVNHGSDEEFGSGGNSDDAADLPGRKDMSGIASHLADMIFDINRGGDE